MIQIWETFTVSGNLSRKDCDASHCCCTRVTDGNISSKYLKKYNEYIVCGSAYPFSAFTSSSISRWSHSEVELHT